MTHPGNPTATAASQARSGASIDLTNAPQGPGHATRSVYTDRVLRAGTMVVAAAGNNAFDLSGPAPFLPSDTPGVLGVGATGIRPDPAFPQAVAFDVLAFYSNDGAPVGIAAPGGDCGLDVDCDPGTRPGNWFEYLVLSSFVDASPVCAATRSCPVGWGYAAGHLDGVAARCRRGRPAARRRAEADAATGRRAAAADGEEHRPSPHLRPRDGRCRRGDPLTVPA
jgi:hypothetical protein